jgi:hypothetical protein
MSKMTTVCSALPSFDGIGPMMSPVTLSKSANSLASAAAFVPSASVIPDSRSYSTTAGTASGSANALASSRTWVDSASLGSHELISLFWTLTSLEARKPIEAMTSSETTSTTHLTQ